MSRSALSPKSAVRGLSVALVALAVIGLWTNGALRAQLADPIPTPIPKRGLSVEIRDVARLPDTRTLRPAADDTSPASWARVSFVRDLPDGRRFANPQFYSG